MQAQSKELLYEKENTGANRLTAALLLVYLVALGWILLLKLGVRFSYMKTRRVSLIPFREYLVYHSRMDKSQIVLNILVFVPLGIYIGILFSQRSFATRLLCCFLVSLGVESLQYALAIGAFDSTDIITNTLGGAIGLLVFLAMEKAFGSHAKAQKVFNTLAVIGTALVLLLLLLLKMNMLPVRYQ
jgi:glycopeptide antibiotics resistance protein